MKCFHRAAVLCGAIGLAVASILFGARLNSWTEDTVAGSRVEGALFRSMDVPGGPVLARRPPVESVPELSLAIRGSPSRSDLYALRAQEEERSVAVAAAESDWVKAATLASDKSAGFIDLADFYHRRVEPAKEISALLGAGKVPPLGNDRFRPPSSQAAWQAFERAVKVAEDAQLAPTVVDGVYETWTTRYPKQSDAYFFYMDALVTAKDKSRAQALQSRITALFPGDVQLQMKTAAKLASIDGGANAELNVYGRQFTPLWPAELRTKYYELLKNAHQLRSFLAAARAESGSTPAELAPVLRIFFHYEQEGKREAADAELLAWGSRRRSTQKTTDPKDLLIVAPLFERVGDYDEAARASYELYGLATATAEAKQEGLASLISLLLEVPEQPLRLGRRDLSLYRNAAEMDGHPGFLNGILSLALNTTFPQYEYQNASQSAVAYFHRAAASRFLQTMEGQFPRSTQLPPLEAKLFGAYAAYGQNETLIRLVPEWLATNRNSTEYTTVAMLLADAYYNTSRNADEFAVYDALLAELAQKSDHVPLGPDFVVDGTQPAPTPRSTDYARVLDRYITRLTQAHEVTSAIALYRKEIDRNPDDPGLYERLALYVEQNRLDSQLAETYRAAFDRFRDNSWAGKLGRLYLRRKQYSDYQALARRITDSFEGSAISLFLTSVQPDAKLSPVLYRQVNLYAHHRFPHNLLIVRNLLAAYQTKATADSAGYEKLLRENWFYDAGLRSKFFEYLSRTGKLAPELASLPTPEVAWESRNVAALEMRAEGLAWITDFETAAGAFVRVAESAPGDETPDSRAISIERSLGSTAPDAFGRAVALSEESVKAAPGDGSGSMRVGEIYADKELYANAASWWNRTARIEPGSAEGYLTAATVFWDYFRYDDALRVIEEARRALRDPTRFAYEAGAIYENKGDFGGAVAEYAKAALAQPPPGEQAAAQGRLIALAKRKDTGPAVQKELADLNARAFDVDALGVAVAVLESENKRSEIHALLNRDLSRVTALSDADGIRQMADRFGFDDTGASALARIVELTTDPVEKIKTRVDLALFRENHGDQAGAERDFAGLLSENPDLLGVVRASANFYWREKKYSQSVSVLSEAAARAKQPFARELQRQAVQQAAEAGQYLPALKLLDQMLASDPYDGDLLAQKAAIFARANDKNGLVQFYSEELKSFQSAALPEPEKTERIAALRRGYIPALIATQQFAEALEQYEQVLNGFPEDEALAQEAARFAEERGLGDRLVAYYGKASIDSPKNYRWPLLLARVNTVLGRYGEAVAAYDKAAYVRPDRTDILAAKADLESRTLRFADSLKTNQKLYELSYHDTRYLAIEAELSARMHNNGEAVRLLRAAYIDAKPKEPGGYVSVMRQLIAWHLFSEADALFRELRPLLDGQSGPAAEAVALEGQALASLHRPADAMAAVETAWREIKGLSATGNRFQYSRAIGEASKEYLTPAETAALAQSMRQPRSIAAPLDSYQLAQAAGLLDVAANALARRLGQTPGQQWMALQQMQSSRLEYETLGRQLETATELTKQDSQREQLVRASLDAYAKAGDAAVEFRLASTKHGEEAIDPQRYAQLFLALHSDLSGLAKQDSKYGNAIVQQLITEGPASKAVRAIESRGTARAAPWAQSYTALAGLYFLLPDGSVASAFDSILGPRTVGGEIAGIHARNEATLRGDTWLYYAARYGDYLGYRNLSGADLLAASLESAPAASNSYVQLGDTYRELKQLPRAQALYRDALQISPERADVYARIGEALVEAGQTPQALESWRQGLRLLTARIEQGPLLPDYWNTAESTLADVNRFRFTEQLRSETESLLRTYVKRNGAYNLLPLVEGLIRNAPDPAGALQWFLGVNRETNLQPVLNELLEVPWIAPEQKDLLYRFSISRAKAEVASAAGDAANAGREQLQQFQTSFVTYLLAQGRNQEAWGVLAQMPREARRPDLMLHAAALTGHLPEQLDAYRAQPETAPPGEQILSVAAALKNDGRPELGLALEEFEYGRELGNAGAPASAYFGLAQVRVVQKRISEAEKLVRTAAVTVGEPFANFPEAVGFLERVALTATAAQYAEQWKAAEPWNAEAHLSWARLKKDARTLETIRQSGAAPYLVRARAALVLSTLEQRAPGNDELALLTHKTIQPNEAMQPFFVWARAFAAGASTNDPERVTLLRQAIALEPGIREQRLDLAAAAFIIKQNALGLAALDSYVSPVPTEGTPGEVIYLQSKESLNQVKETAARVLTERGEYERAESFYDGILVDLKMGPDRDRVIKLRDAVRAESKLAGLNAIRQPVISDQITQSTIVKPKLAVLPADGSE